MVQHRLCGVCHQLYKPYRQLKSGFSWNYILQFIAYGINTFRFTFIINSLIGRFLLAFLIFHIPISAHVIVMLALGMSPNTRTTVILFAFLIHGFLCSIIIHFVIAKLSGKINTSSKKLHNLMVANAYRVGNFRARIKLGLTIARINTKRRFGITYSPFGLVSMASFTKVCKPTKKTLMFRK